jgi:hypothetical protein
MLLIMVGTIGGCSLGVMAGKLLLGDPKKTAAFKQATGTDLTKGEHTLLIVCTAPHGIQTEFPSVQIDIVDRMSRKLDTQGVKVVSSDDVATWYDDHGEWGDFNELAKAFDADFLMHIELSKFTCRVPDAENLLQGSTEGRIRIRRVAKAGPGQVSDVFDKGFQLEFPTTYPVPKENRSEEQFRQMFLDRLSLHLSQYLYDHRMSETVH